MLRKTKAVKAVTELLVFKRVQVATRDEGKGEKGDGKGKGNGNKGKSKKVAA